MATQQETDAIGVAPAIILDAVCRHCGGPNRIATDANPDWQCAICERWQDTIACPTCGQPARISLLPAELVPAPHEPLSEKKASKVDQ